MTQDAPKLEEMISYRVSRLQSLLNRQAIALLKKSGELSPTQWRVLVLLNALNTSTPSQIARATGLNKALISRAVRGLTERDLVSQKTCLKHRGQIELTMTASGREMFKRAQPFMQARHDGLMDSLTDEERANLFCAFDKLEAQVRRTMDDG